MEGGEREREGLRRLQTKVYGGGKARKQHIKATK